jgi:hypothetical protein
MVVLVGIIILGHFIPVSSSINAPACYGGNNYRIARGEYHEYRYATVAEKHGIEGNLCETIHQSQVSDKLYLW